jgi:hypothetical protein
MFADYTAAIQLAYGTKPIETAMFRDGTGGFRGIAVHQFHPKANRVTNGEAKDGVVWGISNLRDGGGRDGSRI